MSYPQVEQQPNFPALEEKTLEYWATDDTFAASVAKNKAGESGNNEFVFYDGPPFANGLPHYGHLLTGFVKDAIPRYQTMRGKHVERRFGWDCHGLPAESEAERQLGISGRQAITDFGIAKFNDFCRVSVLQYTNEWERYVNRQARWVDFEHGYKTLDLSYMESVMWAFKTLWDKGLIYEGFRVLPYSWALETPLSNTETRMDDAYKQVQDPALTVAFRLESGEELLAWTTTPWTLPSNLALAVAPDVVYSAVRLHDRTFILAESRVAGYAKELEGGVTVASMTGADLVGRKYAPMFPYFADRPNSFQVLAGDFVTTDEGTGVVHIAPGFGEDDKRVSDLAGIELVVPVDSRGRFTAAVPEYQGMLVFDANPHIIRALKDRGVVLRHETYDHSYPHCYRTGTPLIYMAMSSWFINITMIKDRMLELNKEIRWIPAHLQFGSFGKWLENARDWNISRNRFWGSPIPVWKSDDPTYPRIDVYGGIEELERDFGVSVSELHRPAVDDLVRPNPDDPTGKSMMRRIPEVLDCWFESGSMPFAQAHYPFENQEWFEQHSPGDFIVEYIPQTRGWFYTMHVLATALFDRPAFSTCVSHGTILGDDGLKMSKSLRNYPDPMTVFDTHGADAIRWYLLSSSILRGTDFAVTEEGIRDTVRQVMLPLWNSWYFLSLYANAENKSGVLKQESLHTLDRYIFTKLKTLVNETTVAFDAYDLFSACQKIKTFLDVLTNWYIRRSRDRFWAGDQDAIDTLHTVLHTVSLIAAPLLPLTTEVVYRGLTGERSIHLQSWPEVTGFVDDQELVRAMDQVRDVCSTALSLRKTAGLRVRLPLASVVVASPTADLLRPFLTLIKEEVNVRHVQLTSEVSDLPKKELQLRAELLGPRLGALTQPVFAAFKRGEWEQVGDSIFVAGVELNPNEYFFKVSSSNQSPNAALVSAVLSDGEGMVTLDTTMTPELEAEGVARDVVRLVQQARRLAGFAVSDRILLTLGFPPALRQQVDAHMPTLMSETLALSVIWDDSLAPTTELDGTPIALSVERVR
ncbi:MAG: isoleucine--tRNA ligase [Ilumatobacteraceae bacterium]